MAAVIGGMSRPTAEQLAALRAEDHDQRPTMIAVCVICLVLAYSSVALRFLARWKAGIKIELDDWLILCGLGTTTGFLTSSFLMVRYGLGRNVVWVTDRESFVKTVISAQVLYSSSIIPVKLSILCLYNRIFPARNPLSRNLRNVSIVTGVVVVAYAVGQAICFVLQCIPMSTLWTGIPGRCINLNAMLTSFGVFNVATDILLVVMPIPCVLGLQLDKSKKLQVVGIFLLGGVVCLFGILRSVFVGTADASNPSRSYLQGAMWSVLEINVGIVSACLPTLRNLFRSRVNTTHTGSNSASAHFSHNQSGNRDYPGIMLSSKANAGAGFHEDEHRPFTKLDDVESKIPGTSYRTESSTDTSPELNAPSRPASRSENRGRPKRRAKEDNIESKSGRGIQITTDIRVNQGA